MSVIFKTVQRPSDPRVENSPKRYYPQLITLGRSVNLKFIAQKIQDRSSLSVGDIKSTTTRAGEKLDLISLDDYLKGTTDGGDGGIVDDPTA